MKSAVFKSDLQTTLQMYDTFKKYSITFDLRHEILRYKKTHKKTKKYRLHKKKKIQKNIQQQQQQQYTKDKENETTNHNNSNNNKPHSSHSPKPITETTDNQKQMITHLNQTNDDIIFQDSVDSTINTINNVKT